MAQVWAVGYFGGIQQWQVAGGRREGTCGRLSRSEWVLFEQSIGAAPERTDPGTTERCKRQLVHAVGNPVAGGKESLIHRMRPPAEFDVEAASPGKE